MQRIMIVSEEPFLRDMVRSALDGLDAEVRCPLTLDEAHRLGREVLFDLVIVLTITPFSCCCEAVRDRTSGMRRPLLYVVAWQHSEQTVLSLLESGVDQYMTFPINLHRLRAKVADELNHFSA